MVCSVRTTQLSVAAFRILSAGSGKENAYSFSKSENTMCRIAVSTPGGSAMYGSPVSAKQSLQRRMPLSGRKYITSDSYAAQSAQAIADWARSCV